jgi:hypothetical protein
VTDELVSVEEAHQLLRIAKKGLAKGGGAGGASILGHGTHPGQRNMPIINSNRRLSVFQIRDPGAFLTPGSGIRDGKKTVSGIRIQDEQPGSYFRELRNQFFGFNYLN